MLIDRWFVGLACILGLAGIALAIYALRGVERGVASLRRHLGVSDALPEIKDFGLDASLPPYVRHHHLRLLEEGRHDDHAKSVAHFRRKYVRAASDMILRKTKPDSKGGDSNESH